MRSRNTKNIRTQKRRLASDLAKEIKNMKFRSSKDFIRASVLLRFVTDEWIRLKEKRSA